MTTSAANAQHGTLAARTYTAPHDSLFRISCNKLTSTNQHKQASKQNKYKQTNKQTNKHTIAATTTNCSNTCKMCFDI